LERYPNLRLPEKEDIDNLSKADSFTKAFACVQSTWLVIQSIARVCQGLPITQLELATMAFVVCALIMYVLWWDKPFGVSRRTVLTAVTYDWREGETVPLCPVRQGEKKRDITLNDVDSMAVSLVDFTTNELKDMVYAFGGMFGSIFGRENLRSPPLKETRSMTFYAAATLFSAFHISAWNWEFPSPIVRTLWRTFAVTASGTGPAAVFIIFFDVFLLEDKFSEEINAFSDITTAVLIIVLGVIYLISRLALLVLTFYCFSAMPAGVYETVDWTKFLPHFS
jgi:hypothetical protein